MRRQVLMMGAIVTMLALVAWLVLGDGRRSVDGASARDRGAEVADPTATASPLDPAIPREPLASPGTDGTTVDAAQSAGTPTIPEASRQRAELNATSILELHMAQLRREIAAAPVPGTSAEYAKEIQSRVDLQKRELMLRKVASGGLAFVAAGEELSAQVKSSLFLRFFGVAEDAEGRKVDGYVFVGPGEDGVLDHLMRENLGAILALAQESCGAFNNLPLEERIRRSERIRELRAFVATSRAIQATRDAYREMRELGLVDGVDLHREIPELVVDQRISRLRW
jgi:hypothetical protein